MTMSRSLSGVLGGIQNQPNMDSAFKELSNHYNGKTRQNMVCSRSIQVLGEVKRMCIHRCRWKRWSEKHYKVMFGTGPFMTCGFLKVEVLPWLVWLSGLSVLPQTEMLLVRFPVKVLGWVVGQSSVGSVWEATNQCFSHTWMFPSLPPSLPVSQ